MRDLFVHKLLKATNLDHVREGVLETFIEVKSKVPTSQIGYVSGIITSDGPEFIERNLKVLASNTEEIRKKHPFPVFSPTDIFDNALFARLMEMKLPVSEREAKFIAFWREVLKCGHVTDIFMTPRWELSKGARDEYETAKQLGLTIHYVPALVTLENTE